MAVTTKKLFPATSNATTTVFSPVGIQLNNQDDLDVYVTLSGGTRVLQLRQSTGSTAQSSHPQVNNTDGLYFPAVTAGTTLYNYQLSTDNNTITFNSALPQGAVVFCERRTRDADSTYTTFASGSTIRATDLNNSSTESNFTAQDGRNKALTIEGVLFRGDQPSTNFVTTDHIVAGTIVTNDIANDSVNADKIPDDTINSEHYVDRSIDTQHIGAGQVTANELSSNSVTTIKITDGNVTRAKLESDIIDGTKLADNAVNSEHYTDGSIDHVHLANDIIDGDNIQDDVVNSEHIAAGALDNEHYAAGSITSDKLNGATVITAAEQGSATTNDTSFLTSAAADARFFNISSGDTIKDGQTFPDNDTTIATTAAINDRIIDIVNDVGGFDIIESEQHFPNTNPQGQAGSAAVLSIKAASGALTPSGTTLTIVNGNLANNANITITGVTSTIPSGFGFIVESTNTLHTYTFHRLVPKATEVTTVAGISGNVTTVAGIAANTTTVAGISSDVTTVAGIASNVTTVANNNSNVTAVATNTTNINAVQSNATNINTVAGSIGNVNTAATNIASVNNASANINSINNFGDQYQVNSNDPSTDGGGNALAAGDLYFNTSANELKVYNGSSWQGGVTAAGSFAATTGNTFTGDNRYNDGVKLLVGTGSDLEIFHHATDGSFINDAGTSTLKLQTGGSTKLEIQSSGVGVTGNIVVSGNVDGRDVAADGSSLDNIEAGNIGTDVTNGNIKLTPNGTGVVEVRGAGGNDGTLQLNCSAQSHGVKIKSPPHSAAQSYTLTLPSSITNNGVLTTNSSGTLSAGLLSNANVDASAAIAGTKISPDFGSQDITTTGHLDLPDDAQLKLGDADDLKIYHDGSHSYITTRYQTHLRVHASEFQVKKWDSHETMATFVSDGAVSLRHNNSTKFATTSTGIDVTGDIAVSGTVDGVDIAALNTTVGNITTDLVSDTSPQLGGDLDTNSFEILLDDDHKIKLGDDADMNLRHTGTYGILENSTGALYLRSSSFIEMRGYNNETFLKGSENGAVELYHDNSKKFETTSDGVALNGHLQLGDQQEIHLGASDDLKIHHNGNHSFIEDSGAGNLFIKTSKLAVENAAGNESLLAATQDGAVELFHNGNKKLETTSSGVTVTGTVAATSFSGDGSNLTGVSSAEIYGFNTDANGNLIVTTTNGGADDISGTTFDAFEDVVFASTGISFSLNASGDLIATI